MADTINTTKNDSALELEAGDVLFFKPPKGGGSFADKAIQQFQKARGLQSWEYVHAAVVVKKNPLTIAHITAQGASEVILGNTAYSNHSFDVNRCTDPAKRIAIAMEAREAVDGKVKYAITTAIPAFLRGDKATHSKSDKHENDALKNEFMCASFVANILAKSVSKNAVPETNLLPGALRKNLSTGEFSAVNRSEAEARNIESIDKNNNLFHRIEKFIQDAEKSGKRGLFQKLSRTVIDDNMRNVLSNLNSDIFLSKKGANPVLNVKDA